MEVASGSTRGDGGDAQAGKEDSPGRRWLLKLSSIGCRKETEAWLSEPRSRVQITEQQILNGFVSG